MRSSPALGVLAPNDGWPYLDDLGQTLGTDFFRLAISLGRMGENREYWHGERRRRSKQAMVLRVVRRRSPKGRQRQGRSGQEQQVGPRRHHHHRIPRRYRRTEGIGEEIRRGMDRWTRQPEF